MWTITFRDLQFRRRRFVIAVLGTALVFAMALVMSGMAAGFRTEADATMAALPADAWLVPSGDAGPFTAFTSVTRDRVDAIAGLPGVERAEPLIISRRTTRAGSVVVDLNIVGYHLKGIIRPPVREGRSPRARGEAVVDTRSKIALGSTIVVGGRSVRVVGRTKGVSWGGGVPAAFLVIEDAQAMVFNGRPIGTTIITRGVAASLPAGTKALTPAQTRADMLRPINNGMNAIGNVQNLLWLVAAMIIGAIVYLSALERVRDFAVLKALGGSSHALFGGLVLQACIVALISAALAAAIAALLAPRFALPITIPGSAFASLPLIAVGVGVLSSFSGLRRAVTVDPALAFGGP